MTTTTRLILALSAYAVLALLAEFTLDGLFRTAVWILLMGLTAKTLIAYKAGWLFRFSSPFHSETSPRSTLKHVPFRNAVLSPYLTENKIFNY